MCTQRSKNIETIENDVSGSDYQGMEQFISTSPWDHRSLLDDVAKDANEAIGDEVETGLFFDETSFLKKGKSTAGVQRQWSGRVGKVENCQVGVFASLGRDDEFALTDFKLKSGVDESRDQRMDKICEDHFESDSVEVSFRQGSKGKLTGRFHTRIVWIWDGKGKSRPRERTLLIWEGESGDLKYSLTNLPTGTSPALLDRTLLSRGAERARDGAISGAGVERLASPQTGTETTKNQFN